MLLNQFDCQCYWINLIASFFLQFQNLFLDFWIICVGNRIGWLPIFTTKTKTHKQTNRNIRCMRIYLLNTFFSKQKISTLRWKQKFYDVIGQKRIQLFENHQESSNQCEEKGVKWVRTLRFGKNRRKKMCTNGIGVLLGRNFFFLCACRRVRVRVWTQMKWNE